MITEQPTATRAQLLAQWQLLHDGGDELVVRAHRGSPHVEPVMHWRRIPGTKDRFALVPEGS